MRVGMQNKRLQKLFSKFNVWKCNEKYTGSTEKSYRY